MEGDKVKTENQPERRKFSLKKFLTGIFVSAIAFILGFIHYRYVSHLFENDRNFSHLSEMEREMSLRTEMGFYYSYYKTVVEERPFIAGISKIMYDRLVEYPKNVNAFNRFNIHPEVIIGAMYRYLEPWLNTSAYRQCHTVDRGPGLAPVESCVGLGQPVYFYLEAIWWLAGLTVATIFLYGTMLSESVFGGLLAAAQYFANHSECTRVQWAPNERENFAAPLLLLHSWLISMQLAKTRTVVSAFQLQVSILVLNCLCLLFWQFTQFIFLTQTAIFFVMEQLKIIDTKTLCILLHSHFCGLHLAVLLLQGNDMLKSSLYAAFFLVVSTYCLFFSSLRIKVQNRLDMLIEIVLVILRISVVYIASRHLKNIISYYLEVEEDRHVWDILYSKFTDYKSFHTLIYTCSDVFDFMPWSTIKKLIGTLLIPFAVISVLNATSTWLLRAYEGCSKELEAEESNSNEDVNVSDESDSGIENSDSKHRKGKANTDLDVIDRDTQSKDGCEQNLDICIMFARNLKVEPAVFYNISQMVVFGIMATLVMRLKLLFVTQLCVVSSLLIRTGNYPVPKSLVRFIPYVLVLTMVPIALHLKWNISAELSHVGEFSDIAQEELLEWIKNGSPPTAAFAGSMPLLAAVMLVTRRPIVAHPHYEHKEARDRAYIVYKTYGRYTPYELYQELSKLHAAYLIVEEKYCYGRSSKGCTFQEIWEIENPQMTAAVTACHALLSGPVDHFYPVFNNEYYTVFKIHDYSVQYMPRSFDT